MSSTVKSVHVAFMFEKPVEFGKTDLKYYLKKYLHLKEDAFRDPIIPPAIPPEIPLDLYNNLELIGYEDKKLKISVSRSRIDLVWAFEQFDIDKARIFVDDKLGAITPYIHKTFGTTNYRPGVVITMGARRPEDPRSALICESIVEKSVERVLAWREEHVYSGVQCNVWFRFNWSQDPYTDEFIVDVNTRVNVPLGKSKDADPLYTIIEEAFNFTTSEEIKTYVPVNR